MALKELPNLTRPVEDDPCFPIYGELIRMLEQDMTVEEAISYHIKNFKFESKQSDSDHELAHILFGFAELKIGRSFTNFRFDYNNNGVSEFIAESMQSMLESSAVQSYFSQELRQEKRQAYKQAFCSQYPYFGTIELSIESYLDGKSRTYNVDGAAFQFAKALRSKPPRSYFEYKLETNPIRNDMASTDEITDDDIDNASFLFEIDESDDYLTSIHDLTLPVWTHILNKMEEEYNRDPSKYNLRQKPQDLINAIIASMKIRDLWNLMPTTAHEPDFDFTDKWSDQPFFEVG